MCNILVICPSGPHGCNKCSSNLVHRTRDLQWPACYLSSSEDEGMDFTWFDDEFPWKETKVIHKVKNFPLSNSVFLLGAREALLLWIQSTATPLIIDIWWYDFKILALHMMTSSNGNIFPVTGPLCREFTGPGEFLTQRPVTRSFDVFFDLRLNIRLSK